MIKLKPKYQHESYQLVSLRKEDIFLIKDWRNAQTDVLRQNHQLTKEDQEKYFQQVIRPSLTQAKPELILFSYLKNEQCIGYGGLTNIDWYNLRAELSFLLDPKLANDQQAYREGFIAYINIIKKIAFSELNLHKIYTETYDFRKNHIEVLESQGFIIEGQLIDHLKFKGKFHNSLIHSNISNKNYE